MVVPEQHRRDAVASTTARSTPASSTTTTGTATRRSRARTATTRRCTSSATRTRARSSASPAPASSPAASTTDDAQRVRRVPDQHEGQQALADCYALEYPLNPDATLDPAVKPFAELEPPTVDVATLNGPQVTELMTAGRPPLTRSPRSAARSRRGAPAGPRPARRRGGGGAAGAGAVRLTSSSTSSSSAPTRRWDLLVRPRIGDAAPQHRPLAVACMAATRRARRRAGLPRRAHRRAGPPLWHGLLVAPLAVPAFVNGYAWVSLDRSVHGLRGRLLIVTLSYFPLVYLPVVAMLRGLDPALEESAWSLGHSRSADLHAPSCCRSCGRPCSAARCSSACTCSPSSARSSCCASRPSRPPSTTSTARPSTAPRRT